LEVEAKPTEVNYPLFDEFCWRVGKGGCRNNGTDRLAIEHAETAGPNDLGSLSEAAVCL
jgi:hypothetical protein